MEKIFHFDSPREHYTADACVLSCYDARFTQAVRKFLKRQSIQTFDHIQIPGSAKALAAPGPECDFVLGAIRTSKRLHGTTRLLLLAHAECGAYGGAPTDTIVADVTRAAGVVLASEPSLVVECYFCDFDGIYRIQ